MNKVMKAQENGDRKPIKTWSRKSTITPDFVGLNFTVHNGKGFLPVYVTENQWMNVSKGSRQVRSVTSGKGLASWT